MKLVRPSNLAKLAVVLGLLAGVTYGVTRPAAEMREMEIHFLVQSGKPGMIPDDPTKIGHLPTRTLNAIPAVLGSLISGTGTKEVPVVDGTDEADTYDKTCRLAAQRLLSDQAISEGYEVMRKAFAHVYYEGQYITGNGRVFILGKRNDKGVLEPAATTDTAIVENADGTVETAAFEYRYHIIVQDPQDAAPVPVNPFNTGKIEANTDK